MKILISTDPEIPVPPKLYGGAERVAHGLIKGLSKKNHEVILLANVDSIAPEASKIIGWKRKSSVGLINIIINAFQLLRVIINEKPDIICCYSRILYLYPSWLFTNKIFFKRYGRFISSRSTLLADTLIGNRIQYTSNAHHMITHLPRKYKWNVIHNMVDVNIFKDDLGVGKEYLVFLGRIEHIKGTKEAVEVAIKTKNKLVICGNVPSEHQDYFNKFVKPYLDSPYINYIGPVNDDKKIKVLQGAKAMLLPLNLSVEAFPNTMIESLACGTPVIGFNIAAVPEAIIDGLNGYIVENVETMCGAVEKIEEIDRQVVRSNAVSRFSIETITEQHLSWFEKFQITK